jgi:hypothetical protein
LIAEDAYLLTSHGTVVARDRATGVVRQCPIVAAADLQPVSIGGLTALQPSGLAHMLRRDADRPDVALAQGPWSGFRVTGASERRCVHLSRDFRFLSADPASGTISLDQLQAGDNEGFLPLRAAELDALRDLLTGDWLVGASADLVRPDQSGMRRDFGLRLGGLTVDLRWQLPLDLSQWPHRLVLLRDGWRIEPINRYRPLVYYAAFGNADIMRQLALSICSLCTVGGYQGAIAVQTDKSAEEIAGYLPAGLPNQVMVVPCAARDRVGFMSARYSIADWPDAWRHQPLLYVDTDIVFDMAVEPLLRAAATADRIAAPIEPEPLRTSTFIGANLLAADGCSPRFGNGFNSGTLAIPNLRQHGGTLALIGRILANYAAVHGRTALPWVDQEVANYVSYRIGHFDTTWLSRHVRLASVHTDPAGRRGLVHFCWVPSGEQRVATMQGYLKQLGALP